MKNFKSIDNKDENMEIVLLYNKLYNENLKELEALKNREIYKFMKSALSMIIFMFLLSLFGIWAFFPIIIVIVMLIRKKVKSKEALIHIKRSTLKNKTYSGVLKEKVIAPIVEKILPSSKYMGDRGISEKEYNMGEWENFDKYKSDDLIITPINISEFEQIKTELVISEVHTQNVTEDSEGNTNYTTLFHGLAGYVDLPKDTGCYIKVVRDRMKLFGGSKNRIDMDMSDFEKVFDVETDDKIKTMQIFTADVMADLIKAVEIDKIRLEFYIKNDRMYIRFHTGELFGIRAFGEPMKPDMLKKYCDIIKITTKIAEDICNKIMNVEF